MYDKLIPFHQQNEKPVYSKGLNMCGKMATETSRQTGKTSSQTKVSKNYFTICCCFVFLNLNIPPTRLNGSSVQKLL